MIIKNKAIKVANKPQHFRVSNVTIIYAVLWLAAQLCPTLCDLMDYSLPGSSGPRGFFRQEYWSGLPCPPQGDLPNPGIKPRYLALQADSSLGLQSFKYLLSKH